MMRGGQTWPSLPGPEQKATWAEYGPRVIVCSRLISTKPDPEQMKNDFFQVGRGPTRSRNRCFMHQSQTHYSNSSLVNRTRREMLPSWVQISRIVKLLCREHFTYHSHNIPFTQPSKDVPCDGKQGGCGSRIISQLLVSLHWAHNGLTAGTHNGKEVTCMSAPQH